MLKHFCSLPVCAFMQCIKMDIRCPEQESNDNLKIRYRVE